VKQELMNIIPIIDMGLEVADLGTVIAIDEQLLQCRSGYKMEIGKLLSAMRKAIPSDIYYGRYLAARKYFGSNEKTLRDWRDNYEQALIAKNINKNNELPYSNILLEQNNSIENNNLQENNEQKIVAYTVDDLEPTVKDDFIRMIKPDQAEGLKRWNEQGIKPTKRWCRAMIDEHGSINKEHKAQAKLTIKSSDVEVPKGLNIKPLTNASEQRVIDKYKKAIFKEMEKSYAESVANNCNKIIDDYFKVEREKLDGQIAYIHKWHAEYSDRERMGFRRITVAEFKVARMEIHPDKHPEATPENKTKLAHAFQIFNKLDGIWDQYGKDGKLIQIDY